MSREYQLSNGAKKSMGYHNLGLTSKPTMFNIPIDLKTYYV